MMHTYEQYYLFKTWQNLWQVWFGENNSGQNTKNLLYTQSTVVRKRLHLIYLQDIVHDSIPHIRHRQ